MTEPVQELDIEARLEVLWKRVETAVANGDKSLAIARFHEYRELHAKRSAEQVRAMECARGLR